MHWIMRNIDKALFLWCLLASVWGLSDGAERGGSPDYSGIFDPTSLLSKEHINEALVDSWEGPTDIAETNVSDIFGDLLETNTFSEASSLFPLSPYNSVSDEILLRCVFVEGIYYNPEVCPDMNCEKYPLSSDFKHYDLTLSYMARLSMSKEGVVLGSAVYTYDTLMIPSVSLISKFVIVFKVEDPKVHSKVSIRLVSVSKRDEEDLDTPPVLRGSSFHSVEQSIVPGKTFYSVDIVGLFSFLPNEFELSQVSVMILPSTPSTQLVFTTESYAVARLYSAVDRIPIYKNGGLGEKAIQQSKYIQVRTSSVFGRSVIDPDDRSKARFNDYCPKAFGGQCLVQITSLKTTSAIGIFGFQLYLAGVVFAIRSAKIYVPVSVFKSSEQTVVDIRISLLRPSFLVTKLDYEAFRRSFEEPISSISVPLSLEPGIKTLIVDITRLFQGGGSSSRGAASTALAIENVLVAISLPKSYVGAIFTLNKAKITYQFDPAVTLQSMDHLNTQTFSNPNIASIETSFFDNNGNTVDFDSSLEAEDIAQGNNTSISKNSVFVSQFSIPFVTTESLQGLNMTLVEKSEVPSEGPGSSTHSRPMLDYTLSIVKTVRVSNLTSSADLEVVSSKDLKLALGGVTRVEVMDLVKKAIGGGGESGAATVPGLNLGLVTFYGRPKQQNSATQDLTLALPFLEIKWNPGSSLSNGVIAGGSFQTKLRNVRLGELTISSWSSMATTATVKRNSLALVAFDFSKIPCLGTITSARASIEFSKFIANGEFEVFLMDRFDWNSSFTKESQSFFNNPTQKYTSDKSFPPTLLAVPFVVDRKSPFRVGLQITNLIGSGRVSALRVPTLGVIGFFTNSHDSEMAIKSMEIELSCSFNDGVYYNTAIAA